MEMQDKLLVYDFAQNVAFLLLSIEVHPHC